MAHSPSRSGGGRKRRAGLVSVLIVLVVGAVLIVLTPRILETKDGRGAVATVVEKSINGSIAFDRLDLGWRGPQSAHGVTIETVDAVQVAKLDVTVDAGLLALLLGRVDSWDAHVGGAVDIEIDEKGGSPLSTLWKGRKSDGSSSGPSSGAVPIDIRMDSLSVHARGGPIDETFDLAGRIQHQSSGAIDIGITGKGDAVPFTLDGKLQVGADVFTGQLSGKHFPTSLFQPWLADTLIVAPRDIGPTVDFELESTTGKDRAITLSATAELFHIDLHTTVAVDGSIRGDRLEGGGTLQPALLKGVDTLRLETPLRYTIASTSFSIPKAEDWAHRLVESAATGTLQLEDPLPVFIGKALTLTDVSLGFRTDQGDDALHLDGIGRADDAPVTITGTVSRLFDADGQLALHSARAVGQLEMKDLPVTTVSSFVSDDDGWLGTLFGSTLDTKLSLTEVGDDLTLGLEISGGETRLTSTATVKGGDLGVQVVSLVASLTPAVLQRLGATDRLARPAPVQVTIKPFELGRWTETARTFPKSLAFTASSTEVVFAPFGDMAGETTLHGVQVQGHVDLTEHPVLHLDANADVPSSGGAATKVVIKDLSVGLDGTGLTMKGSTSNVATGLVEEIAGIDGYLTDSLGPTIGFTVDSNDFSTSSGGLSARVTAPVGWVEGKVEGRQGTIVIPSGQPLTAELQATRPLCEDLIGVIHPALRDICSSQQPVRITLLDASFPTDGDLRKLNAEIKIDIGDAQFNAASGLFAPLDIAQDILRLATGGQSRGMCDQTVAGFVEPIDARIQNGVVTYKKFVIRMGKHRLSYTGSVDLAARTLDIQTDVPLNALGSVGQAIPILPTGITVPIRTTGSFDHLKTEVELDRLVGNVPEAILGPIFDLFKKK